MTQQDQTVETLRWRDGRLEMIDIILKLDAALKGGRS